MFQYFTHLNGVEKKWWKYLSFWPGEDGIIKVCGLGVVEIKHPKATYQPRPFTDSVKEANKDALV